MAFNATSRVTSGDDTEAVEPARLGGEGRREALGGDGGDVVGRWSSGTCHVARWAVGDGSGQQVSVKG